MVCTVLQRGRGYRCVVAVGERGAAIGALICDRAIVPGAGQDHRQSRHTLTAETKLLEFKLLHLSLKHSSVGGFSISLKLCFLRVPPNPRGDSSLRVRPRHRQGEPVNPRTTASSLRINWSGRPAGAPTMHHRPQCLTFRLESVPRISLANVLRAVDVLSPLILNLEHGEFLPRPLGEFPAWQVVRC